MIGERENKPTYREKCMFCGFLLLCNVELQRSYLVRFLK